MHRRAGSLTLAIFLGACLLPHPPGSAAMASPVRQSGLATKSCTAILLRVHDLRRGYRPAGAETSLAKIPFPTFFDTVPLPPGVIRGCANELVLSSVRRNVESTVLQFKTARLAAQFYLRVHHRSAARFRTASLPLGDAAFRSDRVGQDGYNTVVVVCQGAYLGSVEVGAVQQSVMSAALPLARILDARLQAP